MKVCFSIPSYCIKDLPNVDVLEILKNDYALLKKISLPCDVEECFEITDHARYKIGIAVTFYTKSDIQKGYPNIEINIQYFARSAEERRLILLHEIIHACQRVNELSEINKKYLIDRDTELNDLIPRYAGIKGKNDLEIYLFKTKIGAITMFATWIFEIWDEMYLKEKYPDLLEPKMKATYDMISHYYKQNVYSFLEGWAKYAILAEVVRSCYLMKITSGKSVSTNFEDLLIKWSTELKNHAENDEYDKLMNLVESLTDLNAYRKSDVKILEIAYDKVLKMMRDSLDV